MIREGYQQTAIGLIPCDWDVKELRDVTSYIGDGIHSTPIYVNYSEFYFINGNNLVNGLIKITENTKNISADEFYKYKKELTTKTILLSINGTIGNIAFYNNENVILGKSAAYININQNTVENYIFYSLQSSYIKSYFENELTGSTINNLSLESIRNAPILIPKSEKEQKAIAEVLGDVDRLINACNKLIAKKRDIKQGAMQELLTGRSRLPGFSGEWEVKKLGELGEIMTGNTPPTKDSSNYGDKFLFVSPADLGSQKYIYKTDKKLSDKGFKISRKFPKNSILFTCIGSTIGKLGIASFELTSNQQINAIIPNETYSTDYLYYYLDLLSPKIKAMASEQAVPIINKSNFAEISIFYPTLEEQKAITQILSDMDNEIEALEKKRDKHKLVKQGMMQELLTGKTRLL